jgi:glycosyltransferase involved in cell wall biosynthesis
MRLGNLVRHLPAHGWEADVLAGPTPEVVDRTLAEGIESDRVSRVEGRARAPRVQSLDWSVAAARTARRLARNADVVLISGGPFAPFLLGPLLGRRYVLDFRDPWSWEPRFGRLDSRARRRLGLGLERRGEAIAVRRAAAVVTVSPQITETYRRLYPLLGLRIETLRHGFEPADVPQVASGPAVPPELVYAGTFLPGERTPALLVETARRVRESGIPLHVRLLGRIPAELGPLTAEAENEGWLTVEGPVPHRAAVAALQRAAAIWSQPGELQFLITGKIYECLASGRPVVAVAPPDGALAELIAETGGAIVVRDDPEACATAVRDALAGKVPALRRDAIESLAAPVVAGQLASILYRAAG